MNCCLNMVFKNKIKIYLLKNRIAKLTKEREKCLQCLASSNPVRFSKTDSFDKSFPEIFHPIDKEIEKTSRLINILQNQN